MTATLDICAPADQTEGTRSQVLRWLKAVGEPVTQHEPLIELETDKVTVEVPAPASGVLREILKTEQDEIVPGDVRGGREVEGAGGQWANDAGGGGGPVPAGSDEDTRIADATGSDEHATAVGGLAGVGGRAGVGGLAGVG